MTPEEGIELAKRVRSRYWTTIGEHERAAEEPSERSLVGWVCVVAEVAKEVQPWTPCS